MPRLVLLGWTALLLLRAVLAATRGPTVDESFYWLCAQRLDWAYADHPFMTALLVRVGTTWLGDSMLGVRAAFVLLGAAIPVLLLVLARRTAPSTGPAPLAWRASGWALLLPGLAFATSLAVPDVPLLLADLGALVAVAAAVDPRTPERRRTRAWLLAGLCAALACATHYRALVMVAAFGGFLVGTRAGRTALGTRGPWLAALALTLGFLPALLHNLEHDFAPLRYQFAERHGDGGGVDLAQLLLQPIEQAAFITPLVWIALLATAVALVRRARGGDAHAALLAWFALTHLLVYWLLGPWADTDHATVHWPLPGYLPLLVAAPATLATWARRGGWRVPAARLVVASGAIAVAVLGFDAVTARLGIDALHGGSVGWGEVGRHSLGFEHELDRPPPAGSDGGSHPGPDGGPRPGPPPVLVADDYAVGAAIALGRAAATPPDAAADARPTDAPRAGPPTVFVLDHRRNDDHGRQAQFDLWGLDETSLLRTRAGLPALLVVEGELRPARRLRLQELLGPLRPLGVRAHERGGTTRSFGFWAGTVATGRAPTRRANR